MARRWIVFALNVAALFAGSTATAQQNRSPLLARIAEPQRNIEVFGQRLAYYEKGSGEPLILLPHLGWDSHMWARNFDALASNRRVIALDPLGQGASDKPLLDYRMATWTDTLDEFMRLKGVDRAVIGGTGMGGALAVEMALDYPKRVTAIIVGASNSGPGPKQGGIARGPPLSSLAASRELLEQNFFDKRLITDELVRERFAYRMRANDGYVIQRHLADHRLPYSAVELQRIRVPALFIWCREDAVTPLQWGRDFAAATPLGRLAVLERCGHLPAMEQPEAFNRVVNQFLGATR